MMISLLLILIKLVVLITTELELLEVFLLILAILALVPFCFTLYYYFFKRPKISYQIANKSKRSIENKYVYDLMYSLSCDKGRILLNKLYISTSLDVMPEKHPGDESEFGFIIPLEESRFDGIIAPSAKIEFGQVPLFPGFHRGGLLRFSSEEEKNKLEVKFIVDVEIDPFKLKFWSIFQPNFKYRYIEEISIDFENLERQEGIFKKQY